jgi:quercetin 2,3-dioxygenase
MIPSMYSFGRCASSTRTSLRPVAVLHPRRNMEILTGIVARALEHRDTAGGSGIIGPGELQHMKARGRAPSSGPDSSRREPLACASGQSRGGQALAPDGRHAWLEVARGEVRFNEIELKAGDGAALSDETEIRVRAGQPSEVLLFDLA